MIYDPNQPLARELADTLAQFMRLGRLQGNNQEIRKSEMMLLGVLIHGLSPEVPGMKTSELGQRLQITPAAVTHMVNSLVKGGYVERIADPADRRIVLVQPTEKAIEIHQAFHAKHMESLGGLLDHLGEQDSRELIRLLASAYTYFNERRKKGATEIET